MKILGWILTISGGIITAGGLILLERDSNDFLYPPTLFAWLFSVLVFSIGLFILYKTETNKDFTFASLLKSIKDIKSNENKSENKPISYIEKTTKKEYKSLYDKLKDLCSPANFMNPYDKEKVEKAIPIYEQLMVTDSSDTEALKKIRKRAIEDLNVKFVNFQELKSKCNPERFLEPYNAEKIRIANDLYVKLLDNENNEEVLEKIEREIDEKLNYKEKTVKDLSRVRIENGKYGYLNKEGKILIQCKYDGADDFLEGRALVHTNDCYGYIDEKGNEVIPLQYEYGESFSEGLAFVRKNRMFGFIDKNGKVIIPFIYDSVHSFENGIAKVKIGTRQFCIDKFGNEQ